MDQIQQLKSPNYITAYADSRIGGRSENQDTYGYADTSYGFAVTVCDGMGGGPGGKTASTIAVREILTGIVEGNSDDTVQNIVKKAIRRANLAIIEAGKENPSLSGMGSTCTVLLISQTSAIVAHVGDSRVYQLRGRTKVFRTFDHSMVFDLVKQKVITEEQARLSAQSNVITRALGVKPDIEIDIAELPYLKGDRFVLTTDGIHGAVAEPELIAMVADRKRAIGTITDEIVTTIDGKGRKEGGGHDNLTIAIVETKIDSKLKSKMNTQLKATLAALAGLLLISLFFNVKQCGSSADLPADQIASIDTIRKCSEVAMLFDTKKSDYNAQKSIEDSLNSRIDSLNSRINSLNSRLEVLDSIEKYISLDIILSQKEFLKRTRPNQAK